MLLIEHDIVNFSIRCDNFIEMIIGSEVVFQCRDEGSLRAPVKWTRSGGRPLPPGSKDVQGRLEIPNIRVSILLQIYNYLLMNMKIFL